MTTYALKSAGHYYKTRYSKITGGVIHILVSADDWIGEDTSADAGVRYGQTTKTPVSWHGCVDSDSTIDCLPDEYTAYHCYRYNSATIGMELGAKSTDWTAKPAEWVEKVLARMAAWWAPRCVKWGIPVKYEGSKAVIDAKIARGEQWGFTDHAVLNPDTRTVTITDNSADTTSEVGYDMLHVVPRQSAPDWIKSSPLRAADNPGGYVDVDKNTMRHNQFDNVFALGDAGSTPNSKTGAAIRKQAPVVAANLADSMAGRPLSGSYGGYASCPLTTARDKMLLAEFDYTMKPAPSIPFIDTTHERRDMWLLKRYGLPAMYWNLILKGRA